jgi:putative SOS response-associated peptidase YedK
MATQIRYRWRYFDEARGRHCVTSYRCSWDQIRVEHPDATPVDGSRQELELLDNWLANSTAKFGLGAGEGDNADMCGRYALYGPHSRNRDYFGVDEWPDFSDHYNIAPSAVVPIIRKAPDGRRVANMLRWGLIPNWAKDETIGAKLNNARGESVAEKPSFRSAYRKRRCLVPANGFYEWQQVPGQKWKQPYYITLADGNPMAMAGLWESWTDPAGEIIRTFCIITTEANEVMAPIHDRMPVLIRPDAWSAWLDPGTDLTTIDPLITTAQPEEITTRAVSRKVSNAREEGPELIDPA